MPQQENLIPLAGITASVRRFYDEKKAAEQGKMPSEEDPQKTDAPGVQKDYGDDAGKQQLPEGSLSNQNSDGNGENNIPGGEKGEATGKAPNLPEGTNVTADKTQQKIDEAVDDPVTAKVANKGLALAQRISARIKGDSTGGAPEKKAYEAPRKEAPEKKAEDLASNLEATPDLYLKIASLVMGTEEGRQMVDRLVEQEMGKEAAANLIAEHAQLEAEAEAEYYLQEKYASVIGDITDRMSEEDKATVVKSAHVHSAVLASYQTDYEKQAYAMGAEQAAGAMDQEDGMIPGEDNMEAEPSPEEIAEIIMGLVESGEIPPEVAEQLLTELAGAEEAPESEDEALAAAAAEGMSELPPEAIEAAAGGDEAKAASIKTKATELSKSASAVAELFPAGS